jgi:hypothetical protein
MVDALIEHPKESRSLPAQLRGKGLGEFSSLIPFGEIADWGGGNRQSLHTEQATFTKFSGAMLHP